MSRTTGSSSTTMIDVFIAAMLVGVRVARKIWVLSKSFFGNGWLFFCLRRCCFFLLRWHSVLTLRWHPLFAFGLFALPLCGAAPTFLCLPQRKVGKRKRLQTQVPARIYPRHKGF